VGLSAGQRLGAYAVVAPLGAGGMGEVWRATDTRLGRDVALKLLPAAFASDPDRLARFEREAKLLASLSHTHIAGLFALEEAPLDGSATPVRFLAMELAEGEDLAERLKRGAIPVDEAIAIAKQIAEALEAAHEKGIVHRDLKPANVKVSADGHVKVLDFGLAKAWSNEGNGATESSDWSQSPTLARTGTAAGLILGTAAYMSPEQARGKRVDKRADVWSFGVLLFEMLTGKRLFDGETVSDVLAAVLTREPQWNELPATTPAAVRRLLRHCLERNPKNRQHDIADARVALEEVVSGIPDDAAAASPPGTLPLWRRAAPWATLAGVLALTQSLVLWAPWRQTQPPISLRLSVELGAETALATGAGTAAILSPDGAVLAFVGQKAADARSQLYVRRLDQLQASALSGTEGARDPFFSPDGQSIGFFAGSRLKKIGITGGAVVTLCDAPDSRGGSWAEDGSIFFSEREQRLARVRATGGSPEPLTEPDPAAGEFMLRWPQALLGGKAVLFTALSASGDIDDANVVIQRLPAGPRKIVQRGGFHGRYLGSGHLVYVHGATLLAAPFDLERLEPTGEPAPVMEGIASNFFGGAQFAFSARGTLAFLRGQSLDLTVPILWMDREGTAEPLRAVPANYANVRFSPNGRLLAMDIRENNQTDLWVYEWGRDTMSRLTSDPGEDERPVWTPDGRRIAFASARGDKVTTNLYWQRADGTGEAERLTESRNRQYPSSWHPTGRFLAYDELNPETSRDIMILPLEGDEASGWKPGKPTVFLNSPFIEGHAAFSPDGRWLAYISTESGRREVFVRPFPGPGGKWQVSTGGGTFPTWARNRKELFYRASDGTLMVAAFAAEEDSFNAEKPRPWSPAHIPFRAGIRTFDLHPDGQRVAVPRAVEEQAVVKQDKVILIQNFFDELRRLAPTAR
jgi:serine/threonine protein kinase